MIAQRDPPRTGADSARLFCNAAFAVASMLSGRPAELAAAEGLVLRLVRGALAARTLRTEHLSQLFLVQAVYALLAPGGARPVLPPSLADACRLARRAVLSSHLDSDFQAQVCRAAQALEAPPGPGGDPGGACFVAGSVRPEAAVDAAGLFSADIVATSVCGRRVAIEADGPHHFFANHYALETGNTALRNRLLRALPGRYAVVCVPNYLWDPYDKGAQLKLLRALVAEQLDQPAAAETAAASPVATAAASAPWD